MTLEVLGNHGVSSPVVQMASLGSHQIGLSSPPLPGNPVHSALVLVLNSSDLWVMREFHHLQRCPIPASQEAGTLPAQASLSSIPPGSSSAYCVPGMVTGPGGPPRMSPCL